MGHLDDIQTVQKKIKINMYDQLGQIESFKAMNQPGDEPAVTLFDSLFIRMYV